jgi:hypothetical protein
MVLLEGRLGVEQFVLAGPTLHEHEDDVLSLRRKMRHPRRQRTCQWHAARRRQTIGGEQVTERGHANSGGTISKKVASGLNQFELLPVHWFRSQGCRIPDSI